MSHQTSEIRKYSISATIIILAIIALTGCSNRIAPALPQQPITNSSTVEPVADQTNNNPNPTAAPQEDPRTEFNTPSYHPANLSEASPANPTNATWRNIPLAPESRCSPYDSDDYYYPQSVEPKIVEQQGGIYGPYTGTWFTNTRQTDIEHIVARSEAHDSGLCNATANVKKQFATDLINLTLASPSVNRHQKVAKDAAEWLPEMNQCWYVNQIIQVRLKYNLTVDQAEADAIDHVLNSCQSTDMTFTENNVLPKSEAPLSNHNEVLVLAQYDDNENGRISCAEARQHNITPVTSDHPAYQHMQDGDRDGIICE